VHKHQNPSALNLQLNLVKLHFIQVLPNLT
jgi:hypothetical protein